MFLTPTLRLRYLTVQFALPHYFFQVRDVLSVDGVVSECWRDHVDEVGPEGGVGVAVGDSVVGKAANRVDEVGELTVDGGKVGGLGATEMESGDE